MKRSGEEAATVAELRNVERWERGRNFAVGRIARDASNFKPALRLVLPGCACAAYRGYAGDAIR